MLWRRFLFVHELLRTFDENTAVAALRTNATRLVEHLVEFLSEWIVTFVEPAREVTKIRDPELFFIGSGPSGKTFTLLPHWTVSRAEIDHLSALLDVSARMLGPGVRRVEARGHQLSLVSAMYTSLSPFG